MLECRPYGTEDGVGRGGARIVTLILSMLLAARALPACGIELSLEAPTGGPLALGSGKPVRITPRTLYTLVLTIPITSCFRLAADVRVDGRAWDNEIVQPLQPMNRLVWREDEAKFALVASCIFRATDRGAYRVVVIYGDESMGAPQSSTIDLVAE
jgi:hypothetical protein